MRPYEKQRKKGKKERGGAAREKGEKQNKEEGMRGGEGKLH